MKAVLLVAAASLAAATIPASPTEAQFASGTTQHRSGQFVSPRSFDRDFCRDFRRHDGDHRRSRDCVFLGGNLGYLDYGDYDANRSFDPDKWNDWWHERPDRAYPRWVRENHDCNPDRMWWSGSGWHC